VRTVTLTDPQYDELCRLLRFCGEATSDLLEAVEADEPVRVMVNTLLEDAIASRRAVVDGKTERLHALRVAGLDEARRQAEEASRG